MARVLPSVVVAIIKQSYGEYLQAIAQRGDAGPLGAGDAHTVAAILSLVEQVPAELLSTIPPNLYVNLIAATGALRAAVDAWARQGTGYRLSDLRGLGNPLSLVYGALRECRDQAPAVTTAQLAFVDDAALRDALRLDMTEVERAIGEGRWKSATVVGGSVVEALLLWALEKCAPARVQAAISAAGASGLPAPPTSRNDWTLYQLVTVAHAAGLITAGTRAQCDLARNFRNLIHPGRAVRLAERCDQGTAFAAAAAVAFVTRDLEKATFP